MTEPNKQDAAINSDGGTSQNSLAAESNPVGDGAEEKLRKLVADYETRIDEVAEIITRVRHEINNPLTGVLGQAQLLLREELSEKTRKRVETIEELAKRLRDIVGQLRQVQKIPRS
jgi:signal transduction histidine kinase